MRRLVVTLTTKREKEKCLSFHSEQKITSPSISFGFKWTVVLYKWGGENRYVLKGNDLAQLNRSFRCLQPWYAAWICLQCSMLNITNRGLRGCCQGLPVWSLSFSLNCCIGKQTNKRKKKNSHQPLGRKDHLTHTFAGHIYSCEGFFFSFLSKMLRFLMNK